MTYCKNEDPEVGIEKAWTVEAWFDLVINIVIAIITLLTTFLLYKKYRFKEVPLFVNL